MQPLGIVRRVGKGARKRIEQYRLGIGANARCDKCLQMLERARLDAGGGLVALQRLLDLLNCQRAVALQLADRNNCAHMILSVIGDIGLGTLGLRHQFVAQKNANRFPVHPGSLL